MQGRRPRHLEEQIATTLNTQVMWCRDCGAVRTDDVKWSGRFAKDMEVVQLGRWKKPRKGIMCPQRQVGI